MHSVAEAALWGHDFAVVLGEHTLRQTVCHMISCPSSCKLLWSHFWDQEGARAQRFRRHEVTGQRAHGWHLHPPIL